jgi:hypothetical protein
MSWTISAGDKKMRTEYRLLLCLARTSIDDELAEQVKAIVGAGIDWGRLLEAALQHGLMPMLYHNLSTICPEQIPKNHLNYLCDYFHKTACSSLLLASAMIKLLKLFEQNGICAIAYKGPALAFHLFGDLALRQPGDIDILISKSDVLKAKALLVSEGYRPQLSLTGPHEAAFLRSQCEYCFVAGDGSMYVDIHWGIAPGYFSFRLDYDELWSRIKRTQIGDFSIPILSPEDMLLTLCVHGAKHCWDRLIWVCDIAELLRRHKNLAWQQVIERSRRFGCERVLVVGLSLASELLGATLPDNLPRKKHSVKKLTQEASSWLLGQKSTPRLLESCLFHLKVRERLRDRLSYCLKLIFTPTPGDWELVALPSPLFFLYYLLRPMRLFKKYLLDAINPFC